MEILIVVAALSALGLLASRFGADSRDLRPGAGFGAWWDFKPTGLSPSELMRMQHLATLAFMRPTEPPIHARALLWLGANLVRVGHGLQRRAALATS